MPRLFRVLVVAACAVSCASVGAQGGRAAELAEDMPLNRLPVASWAQTDLAVPASAPCRLADQRADIVCPLLSLDGAYYAAIRGQSGVNGEALAAEPPAPPPTQQLATDE